MADYAALLRPSRLEEFVGQRHLVAPGAPLEKLVAAGSIPHAFFFGPPGTGKTSLARAVASMMEMPFFEFNATSLKIDDLRKVFAQYKNALMKPLIFIDEVHRLARNQQEVLLPIMERNEALVIGASTENPFLSLASGIRSRAMLFEFYSLEDDDLFDLLERAKEQGGFTIDDAGAAYLVRSSGGDARAMLKLLEFAHQLTPHIDMDALKSLRPYALTDGAGADETHYNLASALIKSIRGSDADAAIYYLARLIRGGEEPRFIARRLLILASEDIGNANPNALNLAASTYRSVADIGYPESRIILSQLVIYLACSPKSNTALEAIDAAMGAVEEGLIMEVPQHLKDAHYHGAKKLGRGVDYKYPHAFGGWVEQEYTAEPVKFVELKEIGFEKTLADWKARITGEKREE